MKAAMFLVATIGLWPAGSVYAHHPLASNYLDDRTQTIEGTLTELQLRNPHSLMSVEVRDEQGRAERWAVEWFAALQLNRQGVTGETLKPGDRLIITGNPSRRRDDRQLRLRTIMRPRDGWTWGGTFR